MAQNNIEEFGRQVEEAVEQATQSFWATVANQFPEVSTGDFPPDAHFAFTQACERAIKVWLMSNHPQLQD